VIGDAVTDLRERLKAEQGSTTAVDTIQADYAAWLDEAQIEMKLASSNPNAYRAYFDLAKGKQLMDHLRRDVDALIASEEIKKESREHDVDKSTLLTVAASTILAIGFGVLIGTISISQFRQFAGQYESALVETQASEELLSATLLGIGDAVLVTNADGRVTMLNAVAEMLTGWRSKDAAGLDAKEIFNIINETTRDRVDSPIDRVIKEGVTVGLANHTILISRDGREVPIDDSGAPIRDDRGRLVGVVLVFRDISERKEAEEELARIYEREHKIAENLQRSLLNKPDPRRHANLEIDTFYQPAWTEAAVGGDYYDIFALQDGRIVMVVGDVSGKGLEAASRTAEMKYTLRAYLRDNPDAADSVARLNRFVNKLVLLEDTSSFFLCAALLIMDPNTLTGTATVCGTEPPMILGIDGHVRELNRGSMPIGIFDDSEYLSEEFELKPGEIILVSTDGITEARRKKEFLGNEGLAKMAGKVDRNLSVNQIGEGIIQDVKDYASGHMHDDVCLLICRAKSQV
jgi:PAS domain S-box-containing protein